MNTYTPPADLRAQGDQSRKQIAGAIPVGGSLIPCACGAPAAVYPRGEKRGPNKGYSVGCTKPLSQQIDCRMPTSARSTREAAVRLWNDSKIDSRVADRGNADRTCTAPMDNGPDRLSFDDALAMLFEAIGGADLTYSDYAKGALDARKECGQNARTAMLETALQVIDELGYQRLGDDIFPEKYRPVAIAGLRALITNN